MNWAKKVNFLNSRKITALDIEPHSKENFQRAYNNIFKYPLMVFTVLGFGDESKTQVNFYAYIAFICAKVFMVFYTALIIETCISLVIYDDAILPMSKVSEIFTTTISTTQTIITYKNRRYFKGLVRHLWKNHKKVFTKKILKNIRIYAVVFLILILMWFVSVTAAICRDVLSYEIYPYTYFFTLEINNEWLFVSVAIVMSFAWMTMFLIMNIFLLYYCCLCRLLSKILSHYDSCLRNKCDNSKLIQMYHKIAETLYLVDNRFTGQIFLSCILCMSELFLSGYLMILRENPFQTYSAVCTGWIVALFFYVVHEASNVNGYAEKIRNTVNSRYLQKNTTENVLLILNVSFIDVKLTIGNIIVMKRSTILSIVGTFMTYSFLISPQKTSDD